MITHVYTLNTTNQLVDINDTYTSFTTMYSITCDNMQDEFEYAIASQDMLDSKKVHFKKAIGYIEDSVTRNEGKFENWYLILRAAKDTPCKVMLEMTSLDVSPPASPPSQHQQNPSGRSQLEQSPPVSQKPRRRLPPKRPLRPRPPPPPESEDDESEFEETVENFKSTTSPPQQPLEWWWYALLVLVVILTIVFLMWWFGKLHLLPFYKYFCNKTTTTACPKLIPVPNVVVSSPLPAPPSPPAVQSPPPQIEIVEPDIFVAPPPPPPAASSVQIAPPTVAPLPPPPPQLDANFINEMRELKLNF